MPMLLLMIAALAFLLGFSVGFDSGKRVGIAATIAEVKRQVEAR